MAGRMVSLPSNGGTTGAYLATPEAGRGPGVVVIQEWWGLVDHIKDVADRFAREGYVALAPDFYHGQVANDRDAARQLAGALNGDQAAGDVRGAIAYLLGPGGATGTGVGVIGFCLGGRLALFAATVSPDQVAAVADFYATPHPNIPLDLARLKAPVLGAYGDQDPTNPLASIQELEERLRQQGVEADFKVYPGARHAFFNNEHPEVYVEAAARDAWERTLRFFRQHLGG